MPLAVVMAQFYIKLQAYKLIIKKNHNETAIYNPVATVYPVFNKLPGHSRHFQCRRRSGCAACFRRYFTHYIFCRAGERKVNNTE